MRRSSLLDAYDAGRNKERLLNAARDLFVEQPIDVALEDIAQRAALGNAAQCRRFPDRFALMRPRRVNAAVAVFWP